MPTPFKAFACLQILWFLMMLGSAMIPAQAHGAGQPQPVPDETFQDLNGRAVSLSDFREKVLLVNFWGTWCEPCLEEIPELVRLSHRYRNSGLEVIGIAVDSGRPEDIRRFMDEQRMDYPVLIGDLGVVKRQFRVLGFPMSLLIDSEGMIRKHFFGPQNEQGLRKHVESLLQTAPRP